MELQTVRVLFKEWILILFLKTFDRIYRIVRIFFISSFLKKLEILNPLSAESLE
jgi:hypothetical protein